jgi:hypothetical protein
VKVAVAVTAAHVPRWQRDAVAALRALDGVDVRIVDAPAGPAPLRGLDARIGGPALACAPVDADAVAGMNADPRAAAACDVLLNLTSHPFDAEPPGGVWSFRVGENARDALPFATEVARGDAVATVALERRRNGAVETLRAGRFPIALWYPTVARLVLGEAARWPATFVAALRDGAALPDGGASTLAPARSARTPPRAALLASLARRCVVGMRDAFFTVDQWNVGFARGDARALLDGAPLDVRWLDDPPQRSFVADPFVVERDGKRVLFLEDFNYVRDRGVIDALELDADDRVVRRTRALEIGTHLSYPFPLEIDGELYLVPESSAEGEVALYRCVAFPDRWEREAALLPGIDGVDTTVFPHDGRWWALATRYSTGPNVALHAFHAPHPRGPWTPHALNPIVVDVTCARPAGPPFVLDGALYRSGQDCSRTYGGAVVLARIDELTPASYRETFVRRVAPPPGRYADGFHTIAFAGEQLVVDGKRTYRDPRNAGRAFRALRARLARAFARSASHRAPQPQAPVAERR